MIKPFKHIAFAFLLSWICACSGKQKKNETLIRANNLHMESMAVHEDLKEKLRQLQIQAANSADTLSKKDTDSLLHLLDLWEEGMIEVPGFVHQHGQGREHEHQAEPKMTDQSMLEYQHNAKEAIEDLRLAVEKRPIKK